MSKFFNLLLTGSLLLLFSCATSKTKPALIPIGDRLSQIMEGDGYTKVNLGHYVTGHIWFTAKINNRRGRFIIDTGAGRTIVDKSSVRKFSLKTESTTEIASGAGTSNLGMQISKNNIIEIGTRKITGFEIAVIDLSHINRVFMKRRLKTVDGVIGGDLLNQYQAFIDYKGSALFLKTND